MLTDLSNLLVQADFDETDAASMHVGAAATVTLEGVTAASAMSASVAEIDPTSTTAAASWTTGSRWPSPSRRPG